MVVSKVATGTKAVALAEQGHLPFLVVHQSALLGCNIAERGIQRRRG